MGSTATQNTQRASSSAPRAYEIEAESSVPGKSPGQKAMSSLAKAADVWIGNYLLGGVGRLGFHAGKIPGVGATGAYIRDNVRDGFNAAKSASDVRKAVSHVREIEKKGSTLSSSTIRGMARDVGVREEDLQKVDDLVCKGRPGQTAASPEIPLPATA